MHGYKTFQERVQVILDTVAGRGGLTVNIKWCPQLTKDDVVGRDLLRMIKKGMLIKVREGSASKGKPGKSYTKLIINPDYEFKKPWKKPVLDIESPT